MTVSVSVAMPTRGRSQFVDRAISSVVQQTFDDFELIILDGSDPATKSSIRKMARRDPRIIFVDLGDIGLTAARKLGATLAKGRLFALMDSDDYWDRSRLQIHVDVWNSHEIGLSWDRWAEASSKSMNIQRQPVLPGLISPPKLAPMFYGGNFIHASSGIVATKFAKTLGFPLMNILSSDWILFMRASEYYSAYFIGKTLSFKETSAPERISDTEPNQYFFIENRLIWRWAFLNRPSIYGPAWARQKAKQFLPKKLVNNLAGLWSEVRPTVDQRFHVTSDCFYKRGDSQCYPISAL